MGAICYVKQIIIQNNEHIWGILFKFILQVPEFEHRSQYFNDVTADEKKSNMVSE